MQQPPQQPYAPQPYPAGQYPPQQPYPMQPMPQGGYPQPYPPAPVPQRSGLKNFLVIMVALVAAAYIFWPSVFPDFVPDFVPIIGQIDDDTAVLVILSCLRYFGYDLTNIFFGWKRLTGQR